MADYFLHVGAQLQCSHGGQATIAASSQRVLVNKQPVATLSDTTTVAGCAFQVQVGTVTKSQPCTKVQWTVPATRVRVNGVFALTKSSVGICQSAEQIPQGSPTVTRTEMRAKGT